ARRPTRTLGGQLALRSDAFSASLRTASHPAALRTGSRRTPAGLLLWQHSGRDSVAHCQASLPIPKTDFRWRRTVTIPPSDSRRERKRRPPDHLLGGHDDLCRAWVPAAGGLYPRIQAALEYAAACGGCRVPIYCWCHSSGTALDAKCWSRMDVSLVRRASTP